MYQLKPDYYEAYNNIGIAFHFAKKLNEAIQAYEKCILFKPDYADAYLNIRQ